MYTVLTCTGVRQVNRVVPFLVNLYKKISKLTSFVITNKLVVYDNSSPCVCLLDMSVINKKTVLWTLHGSTYEGTVPFLGIH